MTYAANTAYLSQYETEVILRDGSSILLRPIRTDDTERWLVFLSKLSMHAKYLRFHQVPAPSTQGLGSVYILRVSSLVRDSKKWIQLLQGAKKRSWQLRLSSLREVYSM